MDLRVLTDQKELDILAAACGRTGLFSDGTPYVERASCLGWGNPLHGVFLLEPQDKNTVRADVIVRPEHRGIEAVRAGREALMFLAKKRIRVIGITPKDRRDAYLYALSLGMRPVGETHDHWYTEGGA